MRYPNEEIENYRKNAGELENTLIDEFKDGTLSRRELIQRGSLLGLSIPFLGLLAGGAETAFAAPKRSVVRRAGRPLEPRRAPAGRGRCSSPRRRSRGARPHRG